MLRGNQMRNAFINAGFEEKPRRKNRTKRFKCKACGTFMERPDWAENFMWCPACEKTNFFIFSKERVS